MTFICIMEIWVSTTSLTYSNLHMQGRLWMKLYERCEYGINMTLRLNLIKIFTKNMVNSIYEPKPNWNGCLGWMALKNQIDGMKISIKCEQNWIKINLR